MAMRPILLLGAWLLAAARCSEAETEKAPPPEGVAAPPSLSVMYSNPAVDHVVTYSWWRGFGPKGGDRITVRRSGHLVREDQALIGSKRSVDPARSTVYSNIATLASLGLGLGSDGHGGFTLWNRRPGDPRYRLTRSRETRTIAGEGCTVWHAEPLDDRGVRRRGCIARDGVVLYDSWLYGSGGEIAEERSAVKVERRKVAAAEVLPPRDSLSWAAWLNRIGPLEPAASGRPLNYTLRLVADEGRGGSSEELRYRGSGGWESSETWIRGEVAQLGLWHSSGRLRLARHEGQLSIATDPRSKAASPPFKVEPIDRPAERVLGETCLWFDTSVGVQDYSRHECRSADGLPLAVFEGGRGSRRSYVAVSVSRGKTAPGDMMPPPGLLDWTSWGWPELGKAGR